LGGEVFKTIQFKASHREALTELGSRQIMVDAPGRRLDKNAQKGFGRE
jgi:hypothetical protein